MSVDYVPVTSPEEGRKIVANTILQFPVVKPPTLVFIGVPGVGKSTAVYEGFKLAVDALVSALNELREKDVKLLKAIIHEALYKDSNVFKTEIDDVDFVEAVEDLDRTNPYEKFKYNLGKAIMADMYELGHISFDRFTDMRYNDFVLVANDCLEKLTSLLDYWIKNGRAPDVVYNREINEREFTDKYLKSIAYDFLIRLEKVVKRCSKDYACTELKNMIVNIVTNPIHEHLEIRIELLKKLILVTRAILKASLIGQRFPRDVDGIVVDFDGTIGYVAHFESSATFVNLMLSVHGIETLLGIPTTKLIKGEATQIQPPLWAVAVRESALGAVNLDELTNKMSQDKLTAMFAITLQGQVGEIKIEKPVFGTGNDKESSTLVGTLPGPLLTGRLATVVMSPPTVQEWISFMDRKYGDNWLKEWGLFLELFSKYSRTEKPSQALSVSKFFEFGDPFIPDDEIIVQFSRVEPSRKKVMAFPSPRAHEKVARTLYIYKQMYLNGAITKEMLEELTELLVLSTTGSKTLTMFAKMLLTSRSSLELMILEKEVTSAPIIDERIVKSITEMLEKIFLTDIPNMIPDELSEESFESLMTASALVLITTVTMGRVLNELRSKKIVAPQSVIDELGSVLKNIFRFRLSTETSPFKATVLNFFIDVFRNYLTNEANIEDIEEFLGKLKISSRSSEGEEKVRKMRRVKRSLKR